MARRRKTVKAKVETSSPKREKVSGRPQK